MDRFSAGMIAAGAIAFRNGHEHAASEILQAAGAAKVNIMSVDENDRDAVVAYQRDCALRDATYGAMRCRSKR